MHKVSVKIPNWRKLNDPLLAQIALNTRFLYLTEFIGDGILTYSDRDIAAWWGRLNETLENGRLFLTKAHRKHVVDNFDLLLELELSGYKPLSLLVKSASFEFVLAMFVLKQVALGHRASAVRAYEHLRGLQDRENTLQRNNATHDTARAGKQPADAKAHKIQAVNKKVVAEAIELLSSKRRQKREIVGILASKEGMPSAKRILGILQRAGVFRKKRKRA